MARKRGNHSTAPQQPAHGYTVLARRYRPQRFDEVVGQQAIAQALQGAIRAGRVGHAYLFAGPRGVGKTTMARIFARALNCATGPTTEPCGRCDSCRAIATGEDIDVLEIDGASNRGIDEVRELRQNAYYRPSRSRYKIYIIDEVHMLTREAFNALLKILEEPPAHVKFIFATTDPQKIPPTILSRCQRYDFSGIPPDQMRSKLAEILKQEQVTVTDTALELVIRRAAGSMRDALSLLDQLLSFGGKKIDEKLVHSLLGTLPEDRLAKLVDDIARRDGRALLEALDEIEQQGVRPEELISQLLEYFRDLAAIKVAGPDAPLAYLSPSLRSTLVQQAERFGLENVLAAGDILIEARARLRTSQLGRTVTELALLRLATLEDLRKLASLVTALEAGELSSHTPRPASPPEPAAPAPTGTASTSPGGIKKNVSLSPTAESPAPPPDTQCDPGTSPDPPGDWETLVEDLRQELSPLLAVALEQSRAEWGNGQLRVTLGATTLTETRLRELEEAIQARLPRGWRVRLELAPRRQTANAQENLRQEAARDPAVRGLQQRFGARIINVEPNAHGPSSG